MDYEEQLKREKLNSLQREERNLTAKWYDRISGVVPFKTGEKERIAQAALGELPAEGSVFIEAGSTPSYLASALPPDRPLTVVTNDQVSESDRAKARDRHGCLRTGQRAESNATADRRRGVVGQGNETGTAIEFAGRQVSGGYGRAVGDQAPWADRPHDQPVADPD